MSVLRSSVLLAAGLTLSPLAAATNGYFAHGYGSANQALAGAGSAFGLDAISAVTNPASAVQLNDQLKVDVAIFNPQRSFTVDGQIAPLPAFSLALGEQTSARDYFAIPAIGWKTSLSDQESINIVVYGNGGMNTDYDTGVFFGSQAGVDLAQLFVNLGYAYQVSDRVALGFAPIVAYQRFAATGLEAFSGYSSDANALTNQGHDDSFGIGFKAGFTYRASNELTLGLSTQSKIKMDEFEQYAGLFAEQGGFDIPASVNVSAVYEYAQGSFVAVDWQQINYADVASIANPILPNLMSAPLGANTGPGFGWQDMEVIKVGYQHTSGDTQYRLGVSYGEQPIPASEVLFNILAPGVQEWHYTLGMEMGRFSYALMYSPESTVSGVNPLTCDPVSGQCAQTIELKMSQLQVTFGYQF